MYNHILMFGYIASTFSGLLAIILIFVVQKSNIDKKGLYLRTRNFTIVSFLVEFNYFLSFYKEISLNDLTVGPIWRTFDYIVWISLFYFWVSLMEKLVSNTRLYKVKKYYKYLTLIIILLFCIGCVMMMDEYYRVNDKTELVYLVILSIIFFVLSTIVLIRCLHYGLHDNPISLSRKYMLVVTACLIILHMNHLYVDTSLFFGKLGQSGWANGVIDVLWLVFLITNFTTIVFIYKTDFSPLYFRELNDISKPAELTDEEIELDKLNRIAEMHELTDREREVLAYAYKGMTNPEIADMLFISRNTVKKHMHNIFEKIDVSTRTELVYLISIYDHKK
jgi:DNA-binding CsgD family transcriptional regulator